MKFNYDVIVVGAGHAGCEAACASANLGSNTLLITMDMNEIAQMSCNPAIGGVAKGQIVREIDALDGFTGIVTDRTSIQFRMLNRSKGPAMWSPRSQADRVKFIGTWREIIEKTTKRPAKETPQIWALYKEVLDYYDAGMRVPEDVIMLLCDDNWGNVRRLPNEKERKHPGGWGMYYHVDYVGAPRNSKWLNVTPIQNMWEQLQLTYDYGVDKLWVLNVGDIKPMEYPITLFMDMAWDPTRYTAANLMEHPRAFCAQQFGDEQAQQLGLRVPRIRGLIIVAASLTTAAAVSFAGIIGFVGLIVPHILRFLIGPDYRRLLPLSLIGGAVMLLVADVLARLLISPQELPVGIVTALAGAPFFLWILRRSRHASYWS